MIKNILFDCSDTILRFTALDELSRVVGDSARAAEIKRTIHQSRGWNMYDKGEMTESSLRNAILPLFDEHNLPFARWYLDNWLKCYEPIPGMKDIIFSLAGRGLRLFLLSDFPPCFDDLLSHFSDIFVPFEGRAVSFECRSTKADMGIFRHIMEKYSLIPDECLFIDDVPRLVENARSIGINAILFEGAENLSASLKQLKLL